MAYAIDVKYFNSFWIKKVMKSGSENRTAHWPGLPWNPVNYPDFPFSGGSFKTHIPLIPDHDAAHWYIEESRITGGYNRTTVDLGARAYLINEEQRQTNRSSSLIYSGIYNSRTGINDTNVFSVGDAITRSLDPTNGSIQKLYAGDGHLLVFQENKVQQILIDKNSVYSAEGLNMSSAGATVLGKVASYLGEYGISKNPESFAVNGYRKYFVDKNRGIVLRLSKDGVTEISNYGMRDYFKDYLTSIPNDYIKHITNNCIAVPVTITYDEETPNSFSITAAASLDGYCYIQIGAAVEKVDSNGNGVPVIDGKTGDRVYVKNVNHSTGAVTISQINPNFQNPSLVGESNIFLVKWVKPKIIGGWDINNQNYVVSMQQGPPSTLSHTCPSYDYATVAFDETINGWTSFYTYHPNFVTSLKNKYYSFYDASIYEHYDETTINNRGSFYGTQSEANVTFVFNPNISVSKSFHTVNYEGSNGWEVDYFKSDLEGVDSLSGVYSERQDQTKAIYSYDEGSYTENGVTYRAGFNRRENKYAANLVNDSSARIGEVMFGGSISGVKGYFATIKISTDDTTQLGGKKELFAVSSNFAASAY